MLIGRHTERQRIARQRRLPGERHGQLFPALGWRSDDSRPLALEGQR
jgi:hypothetical protein